MELGSPEGGVLTREFSVAAYAVFLGRKKFTLFPPQEDFSP